MVRRRVLAALAAGWIGVGGASADPGELEVRPGPVWSHKVHPAVLLETRGGPAEFLVVLDEQAELGFVASLPTKIEKGRAVFAGLAEVARRAQAPLVSMLDEAGIDYRAYWIANMIRVRGGREILESLASRVEVRRIDANPAIVLDSPAPVGVGPNAEPQGSVEWNVARIQAPEVWALGYDGSGIVIGGQDTGYEWNHPALVASYRGWNGTSAEHDYNWHDAIHSGGGPCGANSPVPCDDHDHGTHTMGTMIGDDGGANAIGVAPGARWIGCRNMSQTVGSPTTYAECFEWFVAPTDVAGQFPDPDRAPHVINNSWYCAASEGCSSETLKLVVENTRAAGIVVVASAGNGGSSCGSVESPPAIYDASFSVGATDSGEQVAGFSSRGPVTVDGSGRLKPNVSAPGVGVRSSVRFGGYDTSSGTSMAGPHVAGLVALLLSARPDLIGHVEEVETLIERAAVPRTSSQECGAFPGSSIPNNTYGWGRVDALETLLGDSDLDGLSNLSDCRPTDGSAWTAPAAVDDLRLDGQATTVLEWSEPEAAGAAFVVYDVLRSASAGDFSSASCIASAAYENQAGDREEPGSAFYYLVRTVNACGHAIGTDSSGAQRSAADCP